MKRLIKSDLWEFRQYAPRDIVISERYFEHELSAHQLNIAIVTPSFNQGKYIQNTIQSVLSQRFSEIRYHVQDGGSTDNTKNVLANFESSLSFECRPDAGQTEAINRGFELVNGEIMAYLNSDDLLLPGALNYICAYFAKNTDVDFIYGNRIFIDQFGYEIGRAVLPEHDAEALKWADYVPQETMFWRRRVWDKIGPFDESLNFAMDWDFLLRAQANDFRIVRLPRFLGAFRVHNGQKTTTAIAEGEYEMSILRERHLGIRPTQRAINKAISRYRARQAWYSLAYRYGLLHL